MSRARYVMQILAIESSFDNGYKLWRSCIVFGADINAFIGVT